MINSIAANTNPITDAMRQRIRELRNKLLILHKALLDGERIAYERVHGAVSSGELLQLVINHEQFAWLHPISELVVRIDEMLAQDQPPASQDDAVAVIDQARTLLTPSEDGEGFAKRYYDALQSDSGAVLSHREIRPLLM